MEEQINLMRDYLKKKDKQISYARKEDNKLRNEFRRDVDDSKQNLTELKLALSKVRTIQEEVVLIKDLAKIEDKIKTSFKNEITRYKEVVKSLKEEVKESHKKISALEKGQIKEKKKRQREFENNQKIWEKKKKHDNTGKLRAMNNIQAEVDPGEKLERDK